MDTSLLADPTRCPDCALALPADPGSCPGCALPLRGPLVSRLWELSTQAAYLLEQRERVLDALRARRQVPVAAGYAGWGGVPAEPASTPRSTPTPDQLWSLDDAPARGPRDGMTPRQIQRILLGLGVLLLAVAALIFTVVAWGRIGIGGRTAILATLTLAAAAGTRLAYRRELPGTAEALATLTLALLLLDAYGVRENDLAGAGGSALDAYWASVLGVLAAVAAAVHRVLPLRTLRGGAALAIQLPLAVLAGRLGEVTLTVAALAQTSIVLAAVSRVRGMEARALLGLGGAIAALGAVAGAAGLAYAAEGTDTRVSAAAGAGLLAGVAGAAAVLALDARRLPLAARAGAAVATAALLAAAHAPMHRALEPDSSTAGGVAVLLAAAALACLPGAPRSWRDGALAAAATGAALAVLDVAAPVARSFAGALRALEQPWTQALDMDARAALGGDWPHRGTVAVTVLLLTLGAALVAARLRGTDAGQIAGAAAAALATASAAVVPVALRAPYLLAVLALVAAGCALLVGAARARHAEQSGLAGALVAAGTLAAGLGLCWSLAARPATAPALLALGVAALAVRAFGARDARGLTATAVAALVIVAEAGVLTAIAGHPGEPAGTVAILGAAVLAVAAVLLPGRRERAVLELTAAGAALAAFGFVATDAHWASIALLAAGTAAALVALRPDRRALAWAAGALLTLSGWIRLAMAEVEAPEAYSTGPALGLLAAGWFARRRNAELSSWAAYGAGLTTGLLPALARTLGEDALARPLLLGAAALLVLLVGVRTQLQAPLVIGALVLAVDALVQLGPYAAALPRWTSIGAAGVLLLVLGVTFERRLRDLRRVAAGLATLG